MPEGDQGKATSAVFRLADRVFQPWKNGGGETAEIAVSPAGADFETFDWRLSTAVVANSGPFSTFPGVDRVLTVLEGGAMVLCIDGREHRLDASCEPFSFSGDVPVVARLESQRLLDFNVMVRRPLQAEVVRGPIDLGRRRKDTRARFALLLEDRANLARLDLVDLETVTPSFAAILAGTQVLDVHIFG